MDKEEILQALEELTEYWDPDEPVDFAYLAYEVIDDIINEREM